MKRRLMNTYDQITMPEDCVQRIEQKLRQKLEENDTCKYTRKISPSFHRHRSRKPVAAMLLVLCISCSLFLFWQSELPVDSPESAAPQATRVPAATTDTWHIGTVQIITQTHKEAHRYYDSVLRGTEQIDFPEWNTQYTIGQYCDRRQAENGKSFTCSQFTLVDMDDDGMKELILRIRPEGEPLDDYLVLRYQKNDGAGTVYCYAELRQMISDLKKDGAFFWEKDNARWVASLKEVNDNVERELSVLEAAQKSSVRWHSLAVADPAFVLDSYLIIAEEGRGEVLGGQFFYFEQLITGKAENNWEKLQEHLRLNGFRCVTENGGISVYDPSSPGCVMFGTLAQGGQLDSIGYYVCDESGERMAEVRGISSGIPEYRVQMQMVWDQNELGKPVATPEEILQYFRD